MCVGCWWIMQEVVGKFFFNFFVYICGVGVVVVKVGVMYVVNIDFLELNIKVGKDNVCLNDLLICLCFVQSDVFVVMCQLVGFGQVVMVCGKKMLVFLKFEKCVFDLVFFDLLCYVKSVFGVVDVINDYVVLMKLVF